MIFWKLNEKPYFFMWVVVSQIFAKIEILWNFFFSNLQNLLYIKFYKNVKESNFWFLENWMRNLISLCG